MPSGSWNPESRRSNYQLIAGHPGFDSNGPSRSTRRDAGVMFERFTDRARRVTALAQEEARSLGHDFITGTEHLLLGLVKEGTTQRQRLSSLGFTRTSPEPPSRRPLAAASTRSPEGYTSATQGALPTRTCAVAAR